MGNGCSNRCRGRMELAYTGWLSSLPRHSITDPNLLDDTVHIQVSISALVTISPINLLQKDPHSHSESQALLALGTHHSNPVYNENYLPHYPSLYLAPYRPEMYPKAYMVKSWSSVGRLFFPAHQFPNN